MREWCASYGARIALFGAIMATLGDFAQLWVVNAGRPDLGLAPPSPGLIVWGTLIGALGIPLYGVGYCARALQRPERSTILMLSGMAFGTLGGIVHASTGVLIASNIGGISGGLHPLQGVLQSGPIVLPLWIIAGLTFLVAGVAELRMAINRQEYLFNPLVLTLLITASASLLELPWCDFVGPAAVNLSHLIFFACMITTNE
jgi:hypothetical protein